MNIYGNAAEWKEHGSYFQFANGARLWFAYRESEKDAMAYQGFSLMRVYIEEVGQFPSLDPMWKLLATLRSAAGVQCQMRMTANPGGPSHFALKAYFVDSGPDKIVRDPETGLTRCFIPSKIIDNPHLLAADPNYINRLRASGSPELQRMWIDGDWDAGLDGQFFTEWSRAKHVIEPFEFPRHWTRIRSGVDCTSCFAPLAVASAALDLAETARQFGIATVFLRGVKGFGRLAPFVRHLADSGLVGIAGAEGPPFVDQRPTTLG